MKKRVTPSLALRVSLTPGVCRWCQCTHERPCANGCGWADRGQTLCTECQLLDQAMRTARGRRELAEFLQEAEFVALLGPSASAKPTRKARR